ncbi:MAG: coproporphyrinogen dehydrogenase HemZ [Clostridiales bacterium]|nr:coproporphyrinogen dehydrogenase HemZ [Clostridiales bacterium]
MFYILFGHSYVNEIQAVSQIFYPNEKFAAADEPAPGGITVVSALDGRECRGMVYNNGEFVASAHITLKSAGAADSAPDEKKERGGLSAALFDALREATGITPAWGVLSGIRPTKIVHELWRAGATDEEVFARLTDERRVTAKKASLCIDIAKAEKYILNHNDGRDMSLYVGIPFCPTRCLYCSFTSYPAAKYSHRLDEYLDTLEREMAATCGYAGDRHIESVYVGGGTPTTLGDMQLERLLIILHKYFKIEKAREFTVEAGRPDTLTPRNLCLMKKYGATRLAINPQTLCDETLERIGRAHTAEMFRHAFEWARAEGHGNINVDLIAGLPGETPEHMSRTMDQVLALRPESVTVHTLAIKRASLFKENLEQYNFPGPDEIEEMLRVARKSTARAGLYPYYMYRQKNMLGNFENTGYCAKDRECLYNVQIMEERQSILALGAGAVTKAVDLERGLVERAFNVKNVDEYIRRLDEMLARKRKILHM